METDILRRCLSSRHTKSCTGTDGGCKDELDTTYVALTSTSITSYPPFVLSGWEKSKENHIVKRSTNSYVGKNYKCVGAGDAMLVSTWMQGVEEEAGNEEMLPEHENRDREREILVDCYYRSCLLPVSSRCKTRTHHYIFNDLLIV